jgi:hypothetical protein
MSWRVISDGGDGGGFFCSQANNIFGCFTRLNKRRKKEKKKNQNQQFIGIKRKRGKSR